jgi:hypothetical protein
LSSSANHALSPLLFKKIQQKAQSKSQPKKPIQNPTLHLKQDITKNFIWQYTCIASCELFFMFFSRSTRIAGDDGTRPANRRRGVWTDAGNNDGGGRLAGHTRRAAA